MTKRYDSNHLKQLRINAGFKTVLLAAKALKISASMLYHLEEGLKMPSVELADRMKKTYKCSFDDIFLPYAVTISNKAM